MVSDDKQRAMTSCEWQ